MTDFDYIWDTLRSGAFTRNAEQRDALLLWLARHIAVDGERAEWVTTPRLGIQKATMNLVAKFFWLLVRNRVSPTKDDNLVTWDRVVMVVELVAGLGIDYTRMILAEIHKRDFRTTTTYPFPSMIFQLCRDSGVPIWHCDKLVHAAGTLDIGLIRDETNVVAPRRMPRVDVPENVDLIDAAASVAPSSSRATPPSGANVILRALVQKLEAQMATLLHHIKPWMRKLIAESEERVEKRMEVKTDQKIQAVHKRLDAFELRVLERPAPTTHMLSFRIELASLRADVDAILATPVVEPQAAPSALGKRHRSSPKTELTEEENARKRECIQEKKVQKASIIDEQLRQQRAREMVAGASSSMPIYEVLPTVADDVSTTWGGVRPTYSTTEGAVTKDVGTTEGDPTVAVEKSGKPDPPVC
uniref:Integrase core domain containing protein n=1 Tax=Solanum tuberosum TaxID=4113 RepID=M1DXG2_SOLTU